MLRHGPARRSDSPCASPLHLVPKKEDGYGDCRAPNARAVPNECAVWQIAVLAQKRAAQSVFSAIDLVKAYLQVPGHPDDIAKTAITPFVLFEFPYVLRSPTRHGDISAVHR
jgi:hypothetical protein